MKDYITRCVLLDEDRPKEQKREEILEYFLKTYELFEKLFLIFKDDSIFYKQPEPLRHKLIFYFGHTASFFVNKLIVAKFIDKRINPKFENMFAIGVDEMSWDDLNDKNYDFPPVDEVREYRQKVKELVVDFIKKRDFSMPITWEDPMWIILMGIEHEKIHIETSSVLHRQLDIEDIKPSSFFLECEEYSDIYPTNELLPVSGGKVRLGKSKDHPLYGWDNEYGFYEEDIEDFKASKYLVSNGEFLEFVEDGGYKRAEFWSEEGLRWREYKIAEHPPFWIKSRDGYLYRTLTKLVPLPLNFPVDVNFLEAEAFCAWKSKKIGKNITLPTEAMWHRLREVSGVADEPEWGEKAPANINLEHFASACPVDRFRHGEFYDVIGNLWQWSRTPIDGFDGFEIHYAYDDFSTPTFDNRHNIFKGGSFISTGNEACKDSRYAFRRHFYQHAGFRYVEAKEQKISKRDFYESDEQISQYCDFHFGEAHLGISNFHKRYAHIASKYAINRGSALELGCSVGRGVFELAKDFDKVTGIDFSARFIRIGQFLKDDKRIGYSRKIEGDIKEKVEVSAKDLELEESSFSKIEFWQGDACNLKPHFSGYDLIISVNLIDRVYDPEKFLLDMSHRLNRDGIFIIASPFSWDESYTKKEKWLCSEGKSSQEKLEEILSCEFIKMCEPFYEEFVIRESENKFQHSRSLFSVWKKR